MLVSRFLKVTQDRSDLTAELLRTVLPYSVGAGVSSCHWREGEGRRRSAFPLCHREHFSVACHRQFFRCSHFGSFSFATTLHNVLPVTTIFQRFESIMTTLDRI